VLRDNEIMGIRSSKSLGSEKLFCGDGPGDLWGEWGVFRKYSDLKN
jgi:hypothetical protein